MTYDRWWIDEAGEICAAAWRNLLNDRTASWPRIYTVAAPRHKHVGRRKAKRALAFARRWTKTKIKSHLPRGWEQ